MSRVYQKVWREYVKSVSMGVADTQVCVAVTRF